MLRRDPVLRAAFVFIAAALAAAAFLPTARAVQGTKVPTQGELFKLRFADDLLSVNDLCPVRKVKLGERMPPVLVNGKVIGFC